MKRENVLVWLAAMEEKVHDMNYYLTSTEERESEDVFEEMEQSSRHKVNHDSE